MKETLKRWLRMLGHLQAQLLLTLLFVLVVTPYALVLRLFGQAQLPAGGWRESDEARQDLDCLRRTF